MKDLIDKYKQLIQDVEARMGQIPYGTREHDMLGALVATLGSALCVLHDFEKGE